MGNKEWEAESVFDLVGDPLARRLLVVTSGDPQPADALAERFDVSLATIYRRTGQLVEYDLMTDHLRMDDGKNQYRVFEGTLERMAFEIDESGYRVEVQTNRDLDGRVDPGWIEPNERPDREAVSDRLG